MNKPIERRAQLLTGPGDLKHCCPAGSIGALEWDSYPSISGTGLAPRHESQAKARLKVHLRKGHDASSLLRIR
jgi:hypothetical protein